MLDHISLRDWIKDNPVWGFAVYCEECIHSGRLHPQQVLERRNPPRRIGDLKARLYCRECRSRKFSIKPECLLVRD